jgi:hypothetical protein
MAFRECHVPIDETILEQTQNRKKMENATGQNKKVPDAMVEGNFFPDEEESTKCIKGAAQ